MVEKGVYFLYLRLKRPLKTDAGALKNIFLPPGNYVYVGSAYGGIAQRIARHKRLAITKKGKLHWHIDYLLVHPQTRLTGEKALAGKKECDVSKQLASMKGVVAPVLGFGASDCRSGCKAHLYRMDSRQQEILNSIFLQEFSRRRENGQSDGAALSRKRKKIHGRCTTENAG
jgi:Uri superfamily endonuclease